MASDICPACGRALTTDAVFCSRCGTRLNRGTATAEAKLDSFADLRVLSALAGVALGLSVLLPLNQGFALLPTLPGQRWTPQAIIALTPGLAAMAAILLALNPHRPSPGNLARVSLGLGILAMALFVQLVAFLLIEGPGRGVNLGPAGIAGVIGSGLLSAVASRDRLVASRRFGSLGFSLAIAVLFGALFVQQDVVVELGVRNAFPAISDLAGALVGGALVGFGLVAIVVLIRQIPHSANIEGRALGIAAIVTAVSAAAAVGPTASRNIELFDNAQSIISVVWEIMLALGGVVLFVAFVLWTMRTTFFLIHKARGRSGSFWTVGVQEGAP